ncbi:DsrE/DsrF/TusD sulfur relay family protein [Leptospirillum ferriphilum]|uniref:FeS-binding protein n=1 Tax=Leptospirillum ferriphilum YSK TaxID=1441628 RepID=A0A059XUE0_9BACT|nr:DsrE family protein [Leptospirillum ferriphilum]AIA30458.1 FeS-binding protein [Leptospirillum ferriphilum YSK]
MLTEETEEISAHRVRKVTLILSTGSYLREAPTTVLRLVEKLLERGIEVNVWAFEEAVTLTNRNQIEHSEPPSLRKVIGDKHAYIGKFIDQLLRAGLHTSKLNWVTCILCAQERGVEHHQMNGVMIGTLGDLWKFIQSADQVIAIPAYR